MNKPLILMIFDMSYSMSKVISSMQSSFDQIIEDQSNERKDADLSVFTFADYFKHDIKPTSFKTKPKLYFKTRGNTALYDAVYEALNSIPKNYSNVLVLIQTDGQDNESQITSNKIKDIVKSKLEQNWEFLYMGANIDVSNEANKIGLKNFAVKFKRDSKGIEQVFNEMSRKISNFRASLDNTILKPN